MATLFCHPVCVWLSFASFRGVGGSQVEGEGPPSPFQSSGHWSRQERPRCAWRDAGRGQGPPRTKAVQAARMVGGETGERKSRKKKLKPTKKSKKCYFLRKKDIYICSFILKSYLS